MKKRTRALAIPPKVKRSVAERDGEYCIVCGRWGGLPNAHFIPRSHGGLGIEQNIVTLCPECHRAFDNSPLRRIIREQIKSYLMGKYPDWDEANLYYRKGENENAKYYDHRLVDSGSGSPADQ